MTAPNKADAILTLANTDGLGPVEVKTREFARYDEAMTLQVDRLVLQWKHLAAPNSKRTARRSSNNQTAAE